MNEYYAEYYKKLGDASYTMGTHGHASRILTLCDWIKGFVPEGGRILDVGCGDAHLSTILPQYEWTGIDLNIERAKCKNVVAHDLMVTPYPLSVQFDAVVCSEVLEHVWSIETVHREVKRLLKKDGQYILSTPNLMWLDHITNFFQQIVYDPAKPWTGEHIRHYTLESHTRYLQSCGFAVEDYTGADSQYSGLMNHAAKTLEKLLEKQHGVKIDSGRVEQLVGAMFPTISHTIMLRARSV